MIRKSHMCAYLSIKDCKIDNARNFVTRDIARSERKGDDYSDSYHNYHLTLSEDWNDRSMNLDSYLFEFHRFIG